MLVKAARNPHPSCLSATKPITQYHYYSCYTKSRQNLPPLSLSGDKVLRATQQAKCVSCTGITMEKKTKNLKMEPSVLSTLPAQVLCGFTRAQRLAYIHTHRNIHTTNNHGHSISLRPALHYTFQSSELNINTALPCHNKSVAW